jgi:plastocyanin
LRLKRSRIYRSLLLAFVSASALVVTGAAAQTSEKSDESAREVQGRVTLILAKSHAPVPDASKVVFWLVPLDGSAGLRAADAQQHKYQMAQRNKSFQPNMLVVPVGTAVDFPNYDPWFHNVFSLYRGKRFDLGLYEAGSRKQVVFDRPGPSYIFCNIHPQMHAVVLAVDSEYFGISDKMGRVSIADVPSGRYDLHIWYENAAPKSLDALERKVEIRDGNRVLPAVLISAVKQDPMKHTNKYGQDYDPADQSVIY